MKQLVLGALAMLAIAGNAQAAANSATYEMTRVFGVYLHIKDEALGDEFERHRKSYEAERRADPISGPRGPVGHMG
jgi:hypothetical protein